MSIYDHDCKMYRFPSFHETLSCNQVKTAQESLKDILVKFPSNSSSASSTISAASSTASSPSSLASTPVISSPPAPQHPLPTISQKRPSIPSDHKWINTCPRSSSSSASSKSSSSSRRNRKTSVGSTTGRRSPARHIV